MTFCRVLCLLGVGLAAMLPAGQAATITTLWNTGGAPGGTLDPHYSFVRGDGSESSAYVTKADAHPFPYWAPDGGASNWISLQPTYMLATVDQPGSYRIRTRFDLTGYDPNTASLHFRVAVDDRVNDILLNGVSLGVSGSNWNGHYWDFLTDTILLTNGFVQSVNVLEFQLQNSTQQYSNPIGFRLEMVQAIDTPEPATIGVVSGVVLALFVWRRKRRS